MSTTEIKRPNYYEGQYLRAQDLIAAQEYQRQQDQRHRLAAHTWGIAVGLELEEHAKPGSNDAADIYIKPGYAVDGFGRAIVVLTPHKISEALFAQFSFASAPSDGEWIPVWLRYREEKTNPPRPGFAVCDVEDQAYRILETFRVVVGNMPSVTQHDRISVAGKLVDADSEIPDASVPYQALPESGDSPRWLIRLGSVRWLAPNPPATTTGHFVKSQSDDEKKKASEERPYLDVVAEGVLAPAGRLRIRDRRKPTDPSKETLDLAGIEGSLRVDGIAHFRDLTITDSFLNVDSTNRNDGKLYFDPLSPELTSPGLTFGFASFEGIGSKRTDGGNKYGLDFYTAAVARLSISNDGKVGIGTTAPTHRLHVVAQDEVGLFQSTGTMAFLKLSTSEGLNNRVEIANRSGGQLSLFTMGAGDALVVTRDGNVGIGTPAPPRKLSVVSEIHSGGAGAGFSFGDRKSVFVDKPSAGERWVWYAEEGTARLWSGSDKLAITPEGNLGLGIPDPTSKLDVFGDALIRGDLSVGGLIMSSDERLKTNIVPLTHVLERVQQIRGVCYEWNETYASLGFSTRGKQIGVLAQEVERVFPELVTRWGKQNYLGLDYARLTAVLIEAVKELTSRIDALEIQSAGGEKPAPRKKR